MGLQPLVGMPYARRGKSGNVGASAMSQSHGSKARRSTYRKDVCVAHDGVGERERDDNFDLQRGDISIHCDILHRVQQVHVAISRLRRYGSGDCSARRSRKSPAWISCTCFDLRRE